MICEVWHWTGRAGNYTGAVSRAKTHTHCRFQMELVFLGSPCVCVFMYLKQSEGCDPARTTLLTVSTHQLQILTVKPVFRGLPYTQTHACSFSGLREEIP